MRVGFRIDELGVDPHAVARPLFAARQHITYAKVFADLFHIDRLALVGEGGAAGDHEAAFDPRESGGQLLGNDIGEIVLRRIAAQIGERKHDHGETRRRGRL
jgi:hypothetical protein